MEEEYLEVEKEAGSLLTRLGWKLSTAESCTGGLLGHFITRAPGSSSYFAGGVIAYSNEVKSRLLGVNKESIKSEGAVSDVVAAEMAVGVRGKFGTEIAVALTGIAGPGGGTAEKPVGLVYTALNTSEDNIVCRSVFSGGRDSVKKQAARGALEMIVEHLRRVEEAGQMADPKRN